MASSRTLVSSSASLIGRPGVPRPCKICSLCSVNAEFSLPFISAAAFPSVFTKLMASVKIGGLFTGQLFGPNDSWNLPESGMNFHSRSDVERLLRGWAVLELTEEDRPGKTKLGEDKHWHIFHIIARRMA